MGLGPSTILACCAAVLARRELSTECRRNGHCRLYSPRTRPSCRSGARRGLLASGGRVCGSTPGRSMQQYNNYSLYRGLRRVDRSLSEAVCLKCLNQMPLVIRLMRRAHVCVSKTVMRPLELFHTLRGAIVTSSLHSCSAIITVLHIICRFTNSHNCSACHNSLHFQYFLACKLTEPRAHGDNHAVDNTIRCTPSVHHELLPS